MKKAMLILFLGLFSFALSAQTTDSLLVKEVEQMKKEISNLKKANSSLKAQISKLKTAFKEDVDEISGNLDDANNKVSANEAQINAVSGDLSNQIGEVKTTSDDLGQWSKKMFMILFVVFGVLFLVLLVFTILNRSRINKNYLKLDAKVDNVSEKFALELKELETKHNEDLDALKKELQEKKK